MADRTRRPQGCLMRHHPIHSSPAALLAAALLCLAGMAQAAGDTMPMDHSHVMHDHGTQGAAASFGAPAPAGRADRTIAVTMTTLAFEPKTLSVKANETVRFAITNASRVDHEFSLGDAATERAHRAGMAAMAHQAADMAHHGANTVFVKAGGTAALTWRFAGPATLEFDCNLPGHFEGGMTGTLIVNAADASSA